MTDEILDNSQSDPSQNDQQQQPNPAAGAENKQTSIINTPEDKAPAAPQTWPDNWREVMAAGDEKELARLQRLKAPTDVYKSYRELEKIKSSFVPAPKAPTKDSTPEEVKAYRDHLGVPESPDKYDLTFDDGTVIGDDLMPQVDGYLKFAHENNLPSGVVKNNLKWFMNDVAREQERLSDLNEEAKINGITDLKSEWGGEFKGNINSINSLFTEAPEGTMDSLLNARGPDGLKFANNPDNIRWLVSLAKSLNPTASLLPSGATDSVSIDTELAKLTSQMHSKDPVERDKYWKDPKAQERFAKLNQAKSNTR